MWEFDIENLTALENLFWAASQDGDYVKAYEEWYQGLTPLIEGAAVELWNREMLLRRNQTWKRLGTAGLLLGKEGRCY